MNLYKRIISSLFAVVISFSLCITSAFAAWQNDLGHWYSTSNLAQWAVGGVLSASCAAAGSAAGSITVPVLGTVEGSVWGAAAGAALAAGLSDIAAYYAAGYTDEDFYDSEADYISTLSATNVSHDGLFEIYPGGWTMGANKWMNPSNIQSYAGGYDWEGYVLEDPDDGTWEWFGVCAQAFSLPAGVYKLWFDDFYGPVEMSWSSIYYGRIPLYLDVCVDGVWSRPATVEFSEYSDDFPKSVTFTVPAGGYPICVMRTDPNLQKNSYRNYAGGEEIKFGFAGHIEAIELAESGSIPESTTRTSSLMQALDAYNAENMYDRYDTAVNYMIGTQASDGSVTDVYSPALYDEETLVFTEPVTGNQYQTTGWTYDYTSRSYYMTLDPGTMYIDGTEVTAVYLVYGDDNVEISYLSGSGATELIQTDTFAYVMVSQSACNINGHTNTVATTKEPTCTAAGERIYTCSVCGNQTAEDIPLLGHAYEYSIYQAATCTADGIGLYSCSQCGNEYTELIPAVGHIGKLIESVPTEYDDNGIIITVGYSLYECSLCGSQYTIQDDAALDDNGWLEGFFNSIKSFGKAAWSAIRSGLGKVFSGFADLLGGIFGFFTDTVIGGVKSFFSTLSDDSILGYYQDETGTAALPEGVGSAMAMIPAFFGGLPAELQAPVIFGIAALFLIAALKLFL